jgi:hypothetical protein
VALALSLLATPLALPALAHGRKAACVSPGHAAHAHAHVCTAHSHKARHMPTDKRHHGGHGAVKGLRATGIAPASPAEAPTAKCENGSAPVSVAQASPSCADGSTPTCADGSSPTTADGGEATLACTVATEQDAGAGETTCEDAAGNPCGPAEEEAAAQALCHEASPAEAASDGPGFICEG